MYVVTIFLFENYWKITVSLKIDSPIFGNFTLSLSPIYAHLDVVNCMLISGVDKNDNYLWRLGVC